MTENPPLNADDIRDYLCDPCAPADPLTPAQRAVLVEHARLTKALGMSATTAEFKPTAPMKPQNWGRFLNDANDPYAALRKLFDRQLDPDAKAV